MGARSVDLPNVVTPTEVQRIDAHTTSDRQPLAQVFCLNNKSALAFSPGGAGNVFGGRPFGGRIATDEGHLGLPWRLSSMTASHGDTACPVRQWGRRSIDEQEDIDGSSVISSPKSSQAGPMRGEGFVEQLIG